LHTGRLQGVSVQVEKILATSQSIAQAGLFPMASIEFA